MLSRGVKRVEAKQVERVEYDIRPVPEAGWIKVGAARCEKCGLERRIKDAEKVD